MELLNYPFVLTDWLFTLVALIIAAISRKKCAYGMANWLLGGQFLIATGFSSFVISMGMYDGMYFNIFMMLVYFQFYHFIGNTGDKYLSRLSLWIGGFHFALIFGEFIDIMAITATSYGYIMVAFMTAQLILAFRGLLYGLDQRINHAGKWRDHHHNGHI